MPSSEQRTSRMRLLQCLTWCGVSFTLPTHPESFGRGSEWQFSFLLSRSALASLEEIGCPKSNDDDLQENSNRSPAAISARLGSPCPGTRRKSRHLPGRESWPVSVVHYSSAACCDSRRGRT